MPTRRQLLALGTGATALLALRALARAAAPVSLYLPLVQGPQPTPDPTVVPTPDPNDAGRIIAPASGQANQAIAWFAARAVGYTLYDITTIIEVYQSLGKTVEVDWFLALAQCAHETGSLTSWWSQRPRRNSAGLGVTGKMLAGTPDAPPGVDWAWDESLAKWREGMSFASWADESIPAHLGRLLAYALPAGAGTPEQQSLISYALGRRALPAQYRGVAPTIIGLNGLWAYPGVGYGESILDLARRMREA
jgi:hypothetical protein